MSSKISELPAVVAANLLDADVAPVVSAGVTQKVPLSELRTKIGVAVPEGRTATSEEYTRNNAVFNVLDFGAKGDWNGATGTDDSAAIQAALTAGAAAKRAVHIPGGGTFAVGTELTLPSNTRLIIDGDVHMTTRLDALFSASAQDNVHVSGKGTLTGTGTSYPVDVSRIFYFTGCSNLSLIGPTISESVWGAHFESCTDFDFDCPVKDISDTVDGSQGYGIIVTLASARWRIAGRFKNIGRHAIYITSGASDGVIDDVVITDCYNTGIPISSNLDQTRIKNISFGSVVLKNVGIVADVNGCSGISVFTNCEGISISDGVVIDTVGTDGIHIEGAAAAALANTPSDITIGSPVIRNVGGRGIMIINSSRVTIVNPRLRSITSGAITLTTTGVGTGSFTDDIRIASYDINGAAAGITCSDDGTGTRLSNISIGWGNMRAVSGLKFTAVTNLGNAVRYTGPQHKYDYTELDLAISQTNNLFVANPIGAYWTAKEASYVLELWGSLSAAPTAGTLTISFNAAGTPSAVLKVDIAIGQTVFDVKMPIGAVPFGGGGKLQVSYTSSAGLLPAGSIDVEAHLIVAPFPAAT